MGFIRNVEERVKLFLYNKKDGNLRSLRIISVIVGILALGLMVYYYGFPHTEREKEILVFNFKALFGYYIFSYAVRMLYSFDIKGFIKSSWQEASMLTLLFIDASGHYIFNTNILHNIFIEFGSSDPQGWYVSFMQIYLLLLAYLEVGKINLNFEKLHINPAVLFILIFAGVIFGGAGMLMLPEMINPPVGADWNFIDSLFTSASATCVTGLMVQETAHFFTFKGQLVLMFLIKIGV